VPLVHVDAYRLSGEAELDDLDLDYEGSVVVVEWGAGLLDGVSDSWLDVVIERPTGARAAARPGEPADRQADDTGDDTGDDPGDEAEPRDAGAAGDADEPRRVTITPHGARWAGVVLPVR
jgi:hypothetical protein